MRRAMLMVFAVAMFMGLSPAGAMAGSSSNSSANEKRCNNPGGGNSKHGCKPCPKGQERHGSKCRTKPKPCSKGQQRHGNKCKPKPCREGYQRHGSKCKPKPCPAGYERHGKYCKPKPCPEGKVRDKDGDCKPPPVQCKEDEIIVDGKCVPRPPEGSPCSKADIVLLEDLLKGTGGLLCLYLGDNAPNASKDLDCPEAALALPIDNLLGACLYLPPAEVDRGGGGSSPLPELPGVPALPTGGTDGLTSLLGGLK